MGTTITVLALIFIAAFLTYEIAFKKIPPSYPRKVTLKINATSMSEANNLVNTLSGFTRDNPQTTFELVFFVQGTQTGPIQPNKNVTLIHTPRP